MCVVGVETHDLSSSVFILSHVKFRSDDMLKNKPPCIKGAKKEKDRQDITGNILF